MPSTDAIIDALSFDIEDWFHMVEIPGLEDPAQWPTLPTIVERRTDEILDICAKAKVKATFFVLGWIADRYPKLVARIASAGHELGTHSFWHRRVYLLEREEFAKDLADSIAAIEAACGTRVQTFRAPSFSITPGTEWAFDVLLDAGCTYDASLFPAKRGHGGYPCDLAPHVIERGPRRLPELPMSVMTIAGKSVCFSGGGYLRLFPLGLIRRGFNHCHAQRRPAVVYLHPRDFAPDCPRVPMPLRRRFKSYVGLASTRAKLERLLAEYRFDTCERVLRG
ncbi:MAG: polysaccharide deacetylase family protein [Phycisphaerales bacterium]